MYEIGFGEMCIFTKVVAGEGGQRGHVPPHFQSVCGEGEGGLNKPTCDLHTFRYRATLLGTDRQTKSDRFYLLLITELCMVKSNHNQFH